MDKLRKFMEENNVDAAIISSSQNRQYLTGYHRYGSEEAYILVSMNRVLILCGGYERNYYWIPSNQGDVEVYDNPGQISEFLREAADSCKKGKIAIGLESRSLPYEIIDDVRKHNAIESVVDICSFFRRERLIKSKEELSLIHRAVLLNTAGHGAAAAALNGIAPRETGVYGEIVKAMQEQSDTCLLIKADVISGVKSAGVGAPIEVMSDKVILRSEPVIVDLSCSYQGYWADTTTTIWKGSFPKKLSELYKIVAEAKEMAVSSIREGIRVCDVASVVKDYFEKKNCMEYIFGDSLFLGHGIGLDYFEDPVLTENNTMEFREGMCVTVEPGLYIKGLGGIRLEDNIWVSRNRSLKIEEWECDG